MRSKSAMKNIASLIMLQIVSVIIGFIIPRLILSKYGSSVNGTISSITQFLSYIVLLESGIGGVVKTALYKPLAENNQVKINGILKASEKFFRVIAIFYLLYVIILSFFFPLLVIDKFNWLFTFSLVLVMGIGTFAQYYFGITYQLLLQSDQKMYITSLVQIFSITINAIIIVILVLLNFNIHIVQLASSLIFVIRPIFLYIYVHKKYKILKLAKPDNDAIKQRWDGFGHHLAFFIHNNIDIVLLSLFVDIKEVSVYSIYFLIVSGVRRILISISEGMSATFGNILARNENNNLNIKFKAYETTFYMLTNFLFLCTAILIVPFIQIYTKGITDVNYERYLFGYIIVAAEAIYCIRGIYSSIILSAGHYKQTKRGAYYEAGINLLLSLILVKKYGLIGVTFGTLIAMLYRTIEYIIYLSKNILEINIYYVIKKTTINFGAAILVIIVTSLFVKYPQIISIRNWLLYSLKISLVALLIIFPVNIIIYYYDFKETVNIFINLFKKNKKKNMGEII